MFFVLEIVFESVEFIEKYIGSLFVVDLIDEGISRGEIDVFRAIGWATKLCIHFLVV